MTRTEEILKTEYAKLDAARENLTPAERHDAIYTEMAQQCQKTTEGVAANPNYQEPAYRAERIEQLKVQGGNAWEAELAAKQTELEANAREAENAKMEARLAKDPLKSYSNEELAEIKAIVHEEAKGVMTSGKIPEGKREEVQKHLAEINLSEQIRGLKGEDVKDTSMSVIVGGKQKQEQLGLVG